MSFYSNYFTWGKSIYLREVLDDGTRRNRIIKNFAPPLYGPSENEEINKDIYGTNLRELSVSSIPHAKKIINERKQTGLKTFGYDKWANVFVAQHYDRHEVADEWSIDKLSIVTIDIECEVEDGTFPDALRADQVINIIGLHDTLTAKYYVFGIGDAYVDKREDCIYIKCDSEKDLLVKFIKLWRTLEPNIVTGWNIEKFDIPYLMNRITKVSGDEAVAKRLSPFNFVTSQTATDGYGNEFQSYDIKGISIIDYMIIYKKLELSPRSSYSLDYIANIDLGKEKLKHETGIPGHLLYREHFPDAVEYNFVDVELVVELEKKKRLIETSCIIAYSAMVNVQDTLSQIRVWDNILYMQLQDDNIHFKIDIESRSKVPFEGAYVKPTISGYYEWVVTVDVTSEYPSLMRALNISPEKLIENFNMDSSVWNYLNRNVDTSEAIEKGYTVGANGTCFKKDKDGIIPKAVRIKFAERKKYQAKMFEAEHKLEAVKAEMLRRGI